MSIDPLPVAILGCGAMAAKIASLLPRATLRLWGRRRPAALPAALQRATWCEQPTQACDPAAVIIFTVPIAALRQVAREVGEVARGDQVGLFVARGVEPGFILPHTIVHEETCLRQIGVLGGPLQTFAAEPGQPAAVVVGSRYPAPARLLRQLSTGGMARVFANRDLLGLEVAGALGNVTSISVGMAAALGMGDTVRGLLLTRGLAEATCLARALGGSSDTFASLAGLGSLIPRPQAADDPHLLLGEALGRGERPTDAALAALEGPLTAAEALTVARRCALELPQVEAVHRVLQGELAPATALQAVLSRGLDFGNDFSPPRALDAGLQAPERWL